MERDLERFVERPLWRNCGKFSTKEIAMITRILTQDECAPDAAECFEEEFTRFTGMSMTEYQNKASYYHDDEMSSWCYGDLRLSIEASNPFWKLERIR